MAAVSKYHRLQVIFDRLSRIPPMSSSLQVYKMMAQVIDEVEDEFLGPETYDLKLNRANPVETGYRMYQIQLGSIFEVSGYTGVQLLLATKHLTFISRYGAIEVQSKLHIDKFGELIFFETRFEQVLFQKLDAFGDGVWHEKNK
ncbi:MAG: hypothetical protein M3Q34_02765 [bacterium]|nr:hypothetical protein [bacterium]